MRTAAHTHTYTHLLRQGCSKLLQRVVQPHKLRHTHTDTHIHTNTPTYTCSVRGAANCFSVSSSRIGYGTHAHTHRRAAHTHTHTHTQACSTRTHTHLLCQGCSKLLQRVVQPQVGYRRDLAGQAGDGHHERKVTKDGVGHTGVPDFHRHHLASREACTQV